MKDENDLLGSYKVKKSENPRADKFKALIRRKFGDGEGKELLQMLKEDYLQAPVSPVGCPDGYDKLREGENNFIRILIQVSNSSD